MKPHIRQIRGVWVVRLCQRVEGHYRTNPARRYLYIPDFYSPAGDGHSVREACEDWKLQMLQAQRA